jgi:hypothetical protein
MILIETFCEEKRFSAAYQRLGFSDRQFQINKLASTFSYTARIQAESLPIIEMIAV